MGAGTTVRGLGGGPTARGSRRFKSGGMTQFGTTSQSRNKENEDIEQDHNGDDFNVKPLPLFNIKSRTAEEKKSNYEETENPAKEDE
jgi:hypothetical protein